MAEYILSCCSTADMSKEYFEERDIKYICFHYELDGVSYLDDLGQSVDINEFYKKMQEGADTKTSTINVEEYKEYFEGFLKEGKDILHLTLSSGITSALNAATIAKNELEESYPERRILVVDSLAASSGYGLLMDKLADERDAGKSLDDLYAFVLRNRLKLNHWFFSSDLTFFVKGGRVSKTAGFVGGMLNICPLLNVDFEGKLIPRQKIRTKKKAIMEALGKMEELAEDGLNYNGKCFISNSACYEDAKTLADMIEEKFPNLDGGVRIENIGTTIGSHTGPGTVALFFWGDERVD